jgi:hypothetical protein
VITYTCDRCGVSGNELRVKPVKLTNELNGCSFRMTTDDGLKMYDLTKFEVTFHPYRYELCTSCLDELAKRITAFMHEKDGTVA